MPYYVFGTNRKKPLVVNTDIGTLQEIEYAVMEARRIRDAFIQIETQIFWTDDFFTNGKLDVFKHMHIITDHQYEMCNKFSKNEN